MKNRMSMVSIDVDAIRTAIKNADMSYAFISRKIGRGSSYIGNCLNRGVMSRYALELLSDVLHVDIHDLIANREKNEVNILGYSASLDVKPDKVRLQILFNGDPIGSAYSKVEGQSETDLMRAISYAAHMIYKLSEQKRLECE